MMTPTTANATRHTALPFCLLSGDVTQLLRLGQQFGFVLLRSQSYNGNVLRWLSTKGKSQMVEVSSTAPGHLSLNELGNTTSLQGQVPGRHRQSSTLGHFQRKKTEVSCMDKIKSPFPSALVVPAYLISLMYPHDVLPHQGTSCSKFLTRTAALQLLQLTM